MKKCKDCKKPISLKSLYCQKCYLSKYNPAKNPEVSKKMSHKKEAHPQWKGGLPKCIECEKQLSRYGAKRCKSCSNKIIGSNNKGKPLLSKTKKKISISKGGTGIPYENKYPYEFLIKREVIRHRDNFNCQCCNMTEEEHLIVIGKVLTIHHIDYNKKNNNDTNLITLCLWCNLRANKNKKYWIEFYMEKTSHVEK